MSKRRNSDNSPSAGDPRRHLASVSALLDHPEVQQMLRWSNRPLVLSAIRQALDLHRQHLSETETPPEVSGIVRTAAALLLDIEGERIRPVVNATGAILHPGLGRAVLPASAVDALCGMNRYSSCNLDMKSGRGGKNVILGERLVCELTGAEAAAIFASDAAALLLALTALCRGREVIVSRGQIVETGESFRLQDCIAQSGATLIGIGTTNKTHLRDYENALTCRTAAILHVHATDYRVTGFTKQVPVRELAALKTNRDLLLLDDLGCGALVDLSPYGFPKQPTVADSLAAGADLVCFSGNLLLGGPQAGIIAGRPEIIRQIKGHPLSRMLRVEKLTELALEKSLRLFLEPETLVQSHPTLRMIAMAADTIRERAACMRESLADVSLAFEVRLVEGSSALYDESLPVAELRTVLIALRPHAIPAEQFQEQLRRHEPPIIARIDHGEVLIDLRTVFVDEEAHILNAVRSAAGVHP